VTDTASQDISKPPALRQQLKIWFENASPFQRSFAEGLGAATIVLLLLFVWMFFRSERTAEKIQSQFPAEAVEILRPGSAVQTAIPNDAADILLQHDHLSENLPQETDQHSDGMNNLGNTGQKAALSTAPLEGLYVRKGELILPKTHIGTDGDVTPFEAYRRPFVPIDGRARVAVVVVDFGLSKNQSKEILEGLPADVTFALSPYANNAMEWSLQIREQGHELWLSLPMQTNDSEVDTGPYAISVNASMQDNQKNLWNVLGGSVGYAGVVSQPQHAFTGNDIDIEPILKQIYGRGLAFAESNPDASGFAETMAKANNTPYVRNNFWVGDNFHDNGITRAIQDTEKLAAKNGQAVMFVHPYPAALEKLALWIAELEDSGIQLVPLSAITQQ
jgi:polysaccharide deacetylase 2 family uncharacterized protein YibQ